MHLGGCTMQVPLWQKQLAVGSEFIVASSGVSLRSETPNIFPNALVYMEPLRWPMFLDVYRGNTLSL
jgi:hypothetical protein